METAEKEATPLQQVLQKLGSSNIVQATLLRLQKDNVKASLSLVYKVIAGTSYRPDIADAFLTEAEAEVARRREVSERARQLVAEA